MSSGNSSSHTSAIKGACPHNCPDTCGWVVTVQDGVPIRIDGDSEHPYTRGWLCTKVNRYLEDTAGNPLPSSAMVDRFRAWCPVLVPWRR
jgi:anaerobic selenocysteine-containing dehydrogenase